MAVICCTTDLLSCCTNGRRARRVCHGATCFALVISSTLLFLLWTAGSRNTTMPALPAAISPADTTTPNNPDDGRMSIQLEQLTETVPERQGANSADVKSGPSAGRIQEETLKQKIQRRNQERLDLVRKECVRKGATHVERDVALYPPESLVVNEEHRVIYCNVPKIGCTSWKRIFLKMGGFEMLNNTPANHLGPNAKGRLYLDFLHKYSNVTHRRFLLRNFTKFVFVRHPFTRILSAFRSKLEPNISFFFRHGDEREKWVSTYGKRIIEKYRGKAEARRVSSDWIGEYDLTFAEFVRFLVDPATNSYNKHWSDVYSMCLPCDIDYDFIGQYETLGEDAEFLLRLINADPSISYPKPEQQSVTNSSDPNISFKFFQHIRDKVIYKLVKLYADDFSLFGYDFRPYLHR